MTDLTIVTCLAPCLSRREFDEAASLLRPLLGAGVPIVVYADDGWRERLQAGGVDDHVRLHASSPSRRLAGFAFAAELAAARATASAPDLPDLDYFVATLGKMGMLHDQSVWNPFGTRHLAWIDADLPASVHGRYFTEARLLDLLPGLLQRFLFLTRPGAVADAAGTPDASRVQGQLFGGALDDIAEANGLYYQRLEAACRDGRLPTDESIFTQMIARWPERFDRFVLQDNGLAGRLFERMRTGRASLERTMIY